MLALLLQIATAPQFHSWIASPLGPFKRKMISSHKNNYQVLGVSLSATPDEIKRAYRKLAMKYHPDHNPKRRSAEERFKLLQQAYEIVSDSERRQQYDRELAEGRLSHDNLSLRILLPPQKRGVGPHTWMHLIALVGSPGLRQGSTEYGE